MKVTLPGEGEPKVVTQAQFARMQDERREELLREQQLWMLQPGEIVVMRDKREPQFWWFASSVDTSTRTVDARTVVFEMPWAQVLPFSRVEKYEPTDAKETFEAHSYWAQLKSWTPPAAGREDDPADQRAA